MDNIDLMEHVHIGEDGQEFNHTHNNINGHNHRHSHENTKIVLNRLSRAAGHLESVKRMIQDERDCSEVLIQLAAVISALNGVSKVILKEHIEGCIVEAIECGDKNAIENLNKAIAQFIK